MQKTYRIRVLAVAALSMLVFLAIFVRLYHVQVTRHEHYTKIARGQQEKTVTLHKRRGDLVDRKGAVLATSTFYDSAYFNPKMMGERSVPEGFVHEAAIALGVSEEFLRVKFRRDYVTPIWRKIPPHVADRIRLLEEEHDLPKGAIFYEKESKRLYPQGDVAGQIIGYTTIDDTGDNLGKEGLERQYDEALVGAERSVRVPVNIWKQGLAPLDENAIKETFGSRVVTTLDSEIQLYAQKAIRRKVGEVQAEAGVAIVMDVETGGIVAMANCPDFDPNDFSRAGPEQRRNRALTDPIEIGSVMKILTATILLDNGLVRPEEPVDCEGGRGFVDGRKFTDSHKLGVVPFSLAFAESSNIAAAKLGLRIEPNLYYKSLRAFGMGARLSIDLPGENSGVLRPVSQWSRLSRTSLPVGYETSMTAVQVASAISAICNDGVRMRPRLVQAIESHDRRVVKPIEPIEEARVARPETCRTMLELMSKVVTDGTGGRAAVPGYTVAGKTGTTRKVMPGRHYIASFAGCIPATDPKLVIYVYVDEPDPAISFYGGHIAAPVFSEIARHAVRILGIPPDRPEELEAAATLASNTLDPLSSTWVENVDGSHMTAKETALTEREIALGESLDADEADPAPPSADSKAKGARDRAVATPTPSPLQDVRRLREIAQARPEIVEGRMPLCVGLTMAETIELMGRAGIPFRLEGAGLAIRQWPEAGAALPADGEAVVTFALPSQRIDPDASADPDAPLAGARP